MKFGYIRVSSEEQNLQRQVEAMQEAGITMDKVFSDKKSGKDMEREALKQLLSIVREGDCIHVVDITRLGRNTKDIVTLIDDLDKKGITIISIKEGVNTSTPTGKLIITIIGALSEMERANIKERQREGIAIAKREGRFNGRPRKPMEDFENVYKQYINNQISMDQALKLLECGRATFYRRAQQYNDNKVLDFL